MTTGSQSTALLAAPHDAPHSRGNFADGISVINELARNSETPKCI
jgi:hypothetical protein